SRRNLEGVRYEERIGELTDFESLKAAVQGVDVVYHLAGVISARDRAGFFQANAEGTGNLARACAEANPGLKRFVYVSSIAAGGPCASAEPRTEAMPDAPISVYGRSKLQGEVELKRWSRDGERFPITIVRPPIVYGPRDKMVF